MIWESRTLIRIRVVGGIGLDSFLHKMNSSNAITDKKSTMRSAGCGVTA
jgi:hypothetical protein